MSAHPAILNARGVNNEETPLPTRDEVLAFVANARAWIASSKILEPVMHHLMTEGTSERAAWDKSHALIPRLEVLLAKMETTAGAPIVGADFEEFLTLSKIMADSTSVRQEFSLPSHEVLEKQIRPAIYERYPEGSHERATIDLAISQINDARNPDALYAAWVALTSALASMQNS